MTIERLSIYGTPEHTPQWANTTVAGAIFGRLLDDGASTDMSVNEFSLPFQVVAILSAIGSLIYGFTVETELEIGSTHHNQTAVV